MSPRAGVALVLAGALAGCATEPPPYTPGERGPYVLAPGAGLEPPTVDEQEELYPEPAYVADPAAGRWAVAALGMPFFIAFKAGVCAGSVAIASPLSALMAVSGPQARREGIEVLGAGVAQNCGPPYVLTP